MNTLTDQLFNLTKLVNKIPKSNSDDISKLVGGGEDDEYIEQQVNKRCYKIMNSVLQLVQYVQPERTSEISSLKQKPKVLLKDLSGHVAKSRHYEDLIERVSEDLLENVNKQIDLYKSDQVAQDNPEIGGQFQSVQPSRRGNQEMPRVDNTIKKPQQTWQSTIDNSYRPFIPILDLALKEFPHHKSLQNNTNEIKAIKEAQQHRKDNINLYRYVNFGDHKIQSNNQSLPHPYFEEMQEFDLEIKDKEYETHVQPLRYKGLDNTPFLYVDTENDFETMKEHLSQAEEIAIDLEHHNYRSFLGITCLMQLSTRTQDFVVDTIKLRHLMPNLREIFSNPSIVKVLHGADMDVEWLQRDFGLYLVNMFDTGQAARVLGYKGFGLAFLLQQICGVIADKKYQLADWRQRPIPEEMLKYAREDTHYLLYIYDNLRKELIEKGLKSSPYKPFQFIKLAQHKSNAICLKQYEKPILKDYNFYMMVARNKELQTRKQLSVLKLILKWRDYIARLEDESPAYVLPNYVLFAIGKQVPTTRNELRDCCRNQLPPLVFAHQDSLLQAIRLKLEKIAANPNQEQKPNQYFQQKENNSKREEDVQMYQDDGNDRIIHPSEFTLEVRELPTHQVKINHSTAHSSIFGIKVHAKVRAKQEQMKKKLDDALCGEGITQLDIYKQLTGNMNIMINDQKASQQTEYDPKIVALAHEKQQSLLGKRKDRELNEAALDDLFEENPVVRVVKEDYKQEQKPKNKTQDNSQKNDDELPKSIKERYNKKQEKANKRVKTDIEQLAVSNKDSINQQETEQDQQQEATKQQEKVKKDWGQIYGQATSEIGELIQKKAQPIDDAQAAKKKKKDKNKKGGGKGKDNKGGKGGKGGKGEQIPKYYMGSVLSDFKGAQRN